MLSVPVSVPAAVGAKATFTVQMLPGVTVAHVVEAVKLAPVVALLITRFAVPQLVTVMGRVPEVVPTGWLPKLMLLPLRHTAGEVATPTPLRLTVCGEPGASSVTEIRPARVPGDVGV